MDYGQIIKKQMKNVIDQEATDSLSDYASNLSNGLSDNYSINSILDATIGGKSIFDTEDIINNLKELFLYEIRGALILGIEILSICIVVGLLKSMTNSFGKKNVSEIALLICSIVIIGLSLSNFKIVYQLAIDTINTISYTMEIILPILLAILISMGAIASGTIMSPVVITSVTIFQVILKKVVFPMMFISTVLVLINCLTEKDYVNKLSKFLRTVSLSITGIIMAIMSGIITLQGLISKTSDNLLVGTARYSIGEFIPIVGGFASDTIELFIKCMGSIKSVIGVFGILIIIAVLVIPIIKIVAIAVIYKVTALVIEPIATKKISDVVGEMGTSLIAVGAILFFSSLLFIIFITSIINLGGG